MPVMIVTGGMKYKDPLGNTKILLACKVSLDLPGLKVIKVIRAILAVYQPHSRQRCYSLLKKWGILTMVVQLITRTFMMPCMEAVAEASRL